MKILKSIWQIDELMVPKIANRNVSNDYVMELQILFDYYKQLLHEFSVDGKDSLYETFKDSINKTTRELYKFAYNYHKGNLLEANKYMRRFFKLTGSSISRSYYFVQSEIPSMSIFYRCRDKIISSRKEIFHTPFELRGYIGSNRFSIPGYPCIYLSSSVKCSIKEVVKNKCTPSIAAFKNTRAMNVYDFRFFPKEKNVIWKYILSYPFKIAASIPTISKTKGYFYNEEYVIPQMILHSTILQLFTRKVDGIIFSSSEAIRKNISINEFEKYDNLVIPSKYIQPDGYCKVLRRLFTLTLPTKIDTNIDNDLLEMHLCASDFEYLEP